MLVKWNSKFGDQWLVLLEFFKCKKPIPRFLSNAKFSIWTFFTRKTSAWKYKFFQISKDCYLFLGGQTDIIFGLFGDI